MIKHFEVLKSILQKDKFAREQKRQLNCFNKKWQKILSFFISNKKHVTQTVVMFYFLSF